MQFSAEMIAAFLEGEVVGNKDVKVTTVAKIEQGKEGALSFLSNVKYEHYIYTTESSIVIVSKDFTPSAEIKATLIKVDDPYASFARLLDLYMASRPQKSGVSSLAFVDSSVEIPDDCYIGEFASIGVGVTIGKEVKIYPNVTIGDNVIIGNNVTIRPGVVVYDECVIGNNIIIHSGAVIGADGFGFAPESDGTFKKIPQIGNVILEDNVEIGANTCVDRATMGSTVVKSGTKLDNLIQIGHNATIGKNCVFASQSGIAGSTTIGDNCMFGGQVGVAGHLNVKARTMVSSQSGISNSTKKEGLVLMGTPAFDASESRRSTVLFKQLPKISNQISKLEKEIEELKALIKK